MKIVIPVDGNQMDSGVCVSFGRTPFFLVYDMETKEKAFIENAAAHSQGGAGIMAAQIVVDTKADVLLTPRCGQNAADVIKASGMNMYKTTSTNIVESIEAFEKGLLGELQEIHAGFHNHGE